MPIPVPVIDLGATAAALSNGAATVPLTTSADAPAGGAIFVWAAFGISTVTFNAPTDSAGNTYVQVGISAATASGYKLGLWVALNCLRLPAGGTITAGATAAQATKEVGAFWLGNVTHASAQDLAVNGIGTAAQPTETLTGTTAQADEVAILAWLGFEATNNTLTFTAGAGYTATAQTRTAPTGTSSVVGVAEYQVLSATQTNLTASGTWSTNLTQQAYVFASFKLTNYGALGMATLASDSTLAGTLTGIGVLGTLGLATDTGLFQRVVTVLPAVNLAGDSTLGGPLGHLGQIATFVDYCPRSGTTYLYKARAVTAQGAYADSAPVSAGVVIASGIFLHVLGQGGTTLHQFLWDVGEKVDRVQPSVAFVQVEGRQYPLAEFDETMTSATLTVNLKCYFDQGVSPPTSTDKKALDTIVYSRSTVCYRDHRGRKTFGAISDYQLTDLNLAYGVVLTMTRSDDSDAV